MPTFARARSGRATLVVCGGQCSIGGILGRQGGDGGRPCCEWWVRALFVIELQYLRSLATAKSGRDYQPKINSRSYATASDAIVQRYVTFYDRILSKLETIPSVVAVAATNAFPFENGSCKGTRPLSESQATMNRKASPAAQPFSQHESALL